MSVTGATIPVPAEIVEAMQELVDYTFEKDLADYGQMRREGEVRANDPGHVFTRMAAVTTWLAGDVPPKTAEDYLRMSDGGD